MTNDRSVHMVVIHDPNSKESRELVETISDSMKVDVIEIQRVHGILPGIRATPAVGVLLWASDLQDIVFDISQFKAYIENEAVIRETLNTLGVSIDA